MAPPPGLSPAAALVRDGDRERFVTALFAPPDRREGLMILYAFNLEVARIRESVREPMAGMIRLQWWRDTLAAVAEGRPIDRHPVAGPLAVLIRERGLPPDLFEALLAARELDLEAGGPADLAAAEAYAEHSSGGLSRLGLVALGVRDEEALAAASHVGTAWALVGQARAVPFHLSMSRLTLPESVLAEAGGSGAAVLAGQAPRAVMVHGVRALAEAARRHLAEARRLRVPRSGLAVLLPAVLADRHLERLHSCGWDPFDARVARPDAHPLRLAWSHWRGRF